MNFYTSISDHYRNIFPLNPVQAQFVNGCVTNPSNSTLLDIGSGTGDLSMELSKTFKQVVGIDIDNSMVSSARNKAGKVDNLEFQHLNMMDLETHYGRSAFDTILCFGNTLVHISSLSGISDFTQQTYKTLKKGGKLLMQIINYDRVLDEKIDSLQTLETDHIIFVRNYHYKDDQHLIEFETFLTIKATKKVIQNKIPLFPIRKAELEKVLLEAGFSSIHFYGNFKRGPWLPGSIPMVIEATA